MIGYAMNSQFNDGSGIINTTIANDYGSFIGGVAGPIFTLAGMFLLYETIIAQRKTFHIQQFEQRFFELVRYHRENVANMKYRIPSSENGEIFEGTSVITELKKQLIDLYRFTQKFIKDKNLYESEDDIEKEAINCSFLILFFGVGIHNKQTLSDYFAIRYDEPFYSSLIKELRKKKTKYDLGIVYYGGHQSKIGYYIRHIFQAIWYVENEKSLDEDKKNQVLKLYRAQLSSSEQAILFFFALSELGASAKDTKVISKYGLIKNIQKGFLSDINPKKYFPEILFEWEGKLPPTQHSRP